MITENDFRVSDFHTDDQVIKIVVSIVIPSIILIIISVAVIIVVIRCLLGDLEKGIEDLNQHLSYVLKDSLDIKIPEYEKYVDIAEIYKEAENLNEIYKVSNQSFFTGSHSERFLKYYKVYQIFR